MNRFYSRCFFNPAVNQRALVPFARMLCAAAWQWQCVCTVFQVFYGGEHLMKKKIKVSSYMRKFRMEQLQSHIRLTASSYTGKYLRISSYILGSPSSYMTLQLLHSELPYIWENLIFFLSVHACFLLQLVCREQCTANEGPVRIQYKCLWFPFMNSQKCNCVTSIFPKQNYNACSDSQFLYIHSYICERFIYFQDWSLYFAAAKYVDRSWEYNIHHSQTHECRNWDWGRGNSFSRNK